MKRNSFNVLFYLKKAKLLKSGEASVCMRITVNGARVENNIRKSIDPALWNQPKECAKGKSRKACDLTPTSRTRESNSTSYSTRWRSRDSSSPPASCRNASLVRTRNPKPSVPSSAPCRSTTTNAAPSWARTMP